MKQIDLRCKSGQPIAHLINVYREILGFPAGHKDAKMPAGVRIVAIFKNKIPVQPISICIQVEAITNGHTKDLVQAHVKELAFNEETKHLVIYVDNAGPMHELSDEECDHQLNSGLKKVYCE